MNIYDIRYHNIQSKKTNIYIPLISDSIQRNNYNKLSIFNVYNQPLKLHVMPRNKMNNFICLTLIYALLKWYYNPFKNIDHINDNLGISYPFTNSIILRRQSLFDALLDYTEQTILFTSDELKWITRTGVYLELLKNLYIYKTFYDEEFHDILCSTSKYKLIFENCKIPNKCKNINHGNVYLTSPNHIISLNIYNLNDQNNMNNEIGRILMTIRIVISKQMQRSNMYKLSRKITGLAKDEINLNIIDSFKHILPNRYYTFSHKYVIKH